jgi:hypothetical protein
MKLLLKSYNKLPYLVIKYEKNEWGIIENKLQEIGLEKVYSERIFNRFCGYFYRSTNQEFANYLTKEYALNNFLDDVNDECGVGYGFNVAVFRVVPNENNEVIVPLKKFLSVVELEDIVYKITSTLKYLLGLINQEVEVNIKLNGHN